ncbi:hypothetical protein L810_5711 [Burkholderia sp. AU4i]|nr:hypothetical protein L810_5711 [Burkholderia sp. AU4i]
MGGPRGTAGVPGTCERRSRSRATPTSAAATSRATARRTAARFRASGRRRCGRSAR